MTKVYISPGLESAPYGILRVIEALHKYLPDYGVTVVKTAEEADVVNVHATAFVGTDKPVLYSSHGLYWEEDGWPDEYQQVNQAMINYMLSANVKAITAVSKWTNNALRRGMLRRPTTIYHGVDPDQFQPRPGYQHQGYVLYNKARIDPVSNPAEMERLASMMLDTGFVATVGQKASNIQVIGLVNHETMTDMVRNAGVYLSLARETFGIGTLEALACGVPVVGWDIGGNKEIIEDRRNGYLVPYGDYAALETAVREALVDEKMRLQARETAVSQWGWAGRIEQYAMIIHSLADKVAIERNAPAVSIVVTAHNLGEFLTDCLTSVLSQSFVDWECLVVDDQSTDDTMDIATEFTRMDDRFYYIPTPHNLLTAGARNYGMSLAEGRYLLPLDADDILAEDALAPMVEALESNGSLHIVYGKLDTVFEDGSNRRSNPWPNGRFNWFDQVAHLNQIPYLALMRREVWAESGGYRTRDRWTEDANFWTHVTSLGFRAGKIDTTTLIYRLRPQSKSKSAEAKNEGWTSWYPWHIATKTEEGRVKRNSNEIPARYIIPWSSQSTDANNRCWPVYRHDEPIISVIIPCGPRHGKYLVDAVDSIQSQTFPWWEAVVVDNTLTDELDSITLPPWVKRVTNSTPSIAISRNIGFRASSAPLVLLLDADDILTPNALADLLAGFVESDGRYAYGDWFSVSDRVKKEASRDYDRALLANTGIHPVTCLIPREWVEDVGGYDDAVPGWEDWDFQIKLAIAGYCGIHVEKITMAYRIQAGQRREQSLADASKTLPILKERYSDYFEGRKQMAGCCGGGGSVIIEAKQRLGLLQRPATRSASMSGMVRIEAVGQQKGSRNHVRVLGVELSAPVRLGNNTVNRYAQVPAADAKLLVDAGYAQYVNTPESIHGIETPKPDMPLGKVTTSAPTVEPETAVSTPEPESEPDYEAIAAGTIKDMETAVIGWDAGELKVLLDTEIIGQNRATAVKLLNLLIADAERVG